MSVLFLSQITQNWQIINLAKFWNPIEVRADTLL